MVRLIKTDDIQKLPLPSNIMLEDIDMQNSAIDVDENGIICSMILTTPKSLLKALNNKFPRTKQGRWEFRSYNEENNHEIIFLYKKDRNGKSICSTFSYLLNQYSPGGIHWWWVNKDTLNQDEILNKLGLFIEIKKTPLSYTY